MVDLLPLDAKTKTSVLESITNVNDGLAGPDLRCLHRNSLQPKGRVGWLKSDSQAGSFSQLVRLNFVAIA